MNAQSLAPQDLVRKAVIEVAQLQESELLVVIEMIGELKKQRVQNNRERAAEILEHAKVRAAEMSHLSREEIMERFIRAMDAIREDAIKKGTAIEGEWESD
ncbi:MAG: hypothetical protein L0287_05695 [Anaerolineae bacterium]|nr:hypothetical protein [Anaerolineae bacterium]MCI0609462.1 hypothetical protein [Anaerolineae bacterium]